VKTHSLVVAISLAAATCLVEAQHPDKIGTGAAPTQKESPGQQEQAANKEGQALFKQRCAGCHEGGVPRAPNREALKQISPENVQFALLKGSMSMQGSGV